MSSCANPPSPSPRVKLVHPAHAPARAAALASPRVFTNGVFDVIHVGHCALLDAARAVGGSLIVGLNSDASTRRLGKGPERPINAQADRAFVLACLQAVDLVVVFDEDTPCRLLERLRPEIYVKGGDYDMATLAEARLVERWGGLALALPLVPGHSSTRIVRRLAALRGAAPVDAAPADRPGVVA
jgi:D-glycero-beta-D-manno-heptose 1-phosphate adenylyltransferase